jgi:signal transduction histidine kinase
MRVSGTRIKKRSHPVGTAPSPAPRTVRAVSSRCHGVSPKANRAALLLCLLAPLAHAAFTPPAIDANSFKTLSLTQLEAQRTELDEELGHLAKPTPRSGTGTIGWSSARRQGTDHPEWAEVRLSNPENIDLIVLVPVLWDYANKGPQASGFPETFEVIAGTENDTDGKVIAHFGPEDQLLPRVAPLAIPLPPTTVFWVRVQSIQMTPSGMDEQYGFGLSEIMLFSGDRNVALNQPVRVSSTVQNWGGEAIYPQALTDETTPFLMNSFQGKQSRTYLARFSGKQRFLVTIDLQDSVSVDAIRFHSAADVRQHIPRPKQVEYGVPRRLIVQGANQADFSDAVTLLDYHLGTVYDAGPILMRDVAPTRCRYIQLYIPDPYTVPDMNGNRKYVNFSELEVLSNGQNVAKGKPVTFPRYLRNNDNKEAITDGCNNFGIILPTRDWMVQLSRRHDLEKARPLLAAELDHRYARQKIYLSLMIWLAVTLAAGIAFTILIDRMLRMRYVSRLKQRFAADLHDELGANLHSIGLISDVAQHAESCEQWKTLSQRIRELTERTGIAVRHCTNLLEADDLYIGLANDMQRTAERITTNLQHDFTIEGTPFLEQLKPRTRIDLFLFYKECLVNICRHSGATQIYTHLVAQKKEILLTVCDNGKGLVGGQIPASLKRRARLLKANLTAECPSSGGTQITLRLRSRRRAGFKTHGSKNHGQLPLTPS